MLEKKSKKFKNLKINAGLGESNFGLSFSLKYSYCVIFPNYVFSSEFDKGMWLYKEDINSLYQEADVL